MTFKDRWRNYNSIGIFCIVFIVFLTCFVIRNIFGKIEKQENTEEWINISDFPTTLEIDREGKLLSYPEVIVLAESDGQVMNMSVTQGDIVQEWDVLMQIGEEDGIDENTDIDTRIGRKFAEYYQVKDEYEQFESDFGDEISILESKLMQYNVEFSIAVDTQNEKDIESIQEKIQDVDGNLNLLKKQRDSLKSDMMRLENEILIENQENIEYYYELDKKMPRAPIQGVVSEIYVQEGDDVKIGDELLKIIDNTYSPEIAVGLSFNEYVLTQDLTGVMIITENENRGDSYYEGEIYTRSPKINEDGEYTLTVRILEEVSDLILNDKNTKITVIFTKDYPTIWIPKNCFTHMGENSGILTLRDGEVITGKQVGIKNKWENWINIDNLALFGLEKEDEKDGIQLCIEDWNNEWYKDESVVERRNQFETLEDFCAEFIKVNPMYWTGHRNTAVVSLLGGLGEKIEILCK